MGYKVWVLDPDPTAPPASSPTGTWSPPTTTSDALDRPGGNLRRGHHRVRERPGRHARLPGQVHPGAPRRRARSRCARTASPKSPSSRQRPARTALRRHPQRGATSPPPTPAFFPAILKVARFGYDGKGRPASPTPPRRCCLPPVQGRALRAGADAAARLRSLGGAGARRGGQCACFPTGENRHTQRHPRRLHRAGAHLRLPCQQAQLRPRRSPKRIAESWLRRHAGRRVLRRAAASWW
jgi:5-(carboxyamino)imidazole ribonucleotide synthase